VGVRKQPFSGEESVRQIAVRISAEAPQPVMSCVDDNRVSTHMLKLNERLTDPYENMAAPIVRRRLAQAGARLALLLNQLWR
jgi:hypothetical protein